MAIAFPGESAEYRAARDRLLEQEIELRRATEAVAAARRRLPPGGIVPQDYVFQAQGPGGAPAQVRLSELFAPGKDSLAIYSMMFPRAPGDTRPGPAGGQTALLPLAQGPCPPSTPFLDHRAAAPGHPPHPTNPPAPGAHPLPRGGGAGGGRFRCSPRGGPLLTAPSRAEPPGADLRRLLNVSPGAGTPTRHFWGSELFYAPAAPGQDPRHVGTLEPVWNLYDLTPEGRGTDWDEQLSY